MKVRRVLPIVVFAVVLGIHAAWRLRDRSTGSWVPIERDEVEAAGQSYMGGGQVWLGLSYAAAAAFAAFCLTRLRDGRSPSVAGAAGGVALMGFLYAAGCFLLGCCGSPMLGVYAGLLGTRLLGLTGPIVFAGTVASVAVGYVCVTQLHALPRGYCEDSSGEGRTTAARELEHGSPHWVMGKLHTGAGDLPKVATSWQPKDYLGAIAARIGLNRMRYSVPPGLYGVGNPSRESLVFVTANCKLSFDHLRTALAGRSAWILVLDTKGINVWCAAGGGAFSTEEVTNRIKASRLQELVSHRTLILPQLSASGVAAHEVKERSGFHVVYGPVRAADLPAFLEGGMKASPQMRRVTFPLPDRLVLIPMEVVPGLKYAALVAAGMLVLAGLGREGYSFARALDEGWGAALICLVGFLGGAAATPALLPWLPGRAFSIKGAFVGIVAALVQALFSLRSSAGLTPYLEALAWLLILPAISSFFAMNFTGASNYTSLSGVKKETRFAVPAQIAAMTIGVGLWMAARLTGYSGSGG